MTHVNAILAHGEPIYCAANVRLWQDTGLHFFARGKRTETRCVVWHHTAAENPPDVMFRSLVERGLSVHFAIDQVGTVWQFCDADDFGAHAKGANGFSVGIEIVNRAFGTNAKWPRETALETVHGKTARVTLFYPAQVTAAKALALSLSKAYGLPLAVPTNEAGELIARQLSAKELASFRGHLGHYHAHAAKRDPGLALLAEFQRAWDGDA